MNILYAALCWLSGVVGLAAGGTPEASAPFFAATFICLAMKD